MSSPPRSGKPQRTQAQRAYAAPQSLKSYERGSIHIDAKYMPQMPDETSRCYLFVAIVRGTGWVFVQIKSLKKAAAANSFLNALQKACQIKMQKILTDSGKELSDRLFASRERQATDNHKFDKLCQTLSIEHRLTKLGTPRTNGMVELFNGKIAGVLTTHQFTSVDNLAQTLMRYVALYNNKLTQLVPKEITPDEGHERLVRFSSTFVNKTSE